MRAIFLRSSLTNTTARAQNFAPSRFDKPRGTVRYGVIPQRRAHRAKAALTLTLTYYAREGADGQAVVCPLLRGSSPTRWVAPKQHRGLKPQELDRQAICSISITTFSGRSGCFWSMSIQSASGGSRLASEPLKCRQSAQSGHRSDATTIHSASASWLARSRVPAADTDRAPVNVIARLGSHIGRMRSVGQYRQAATNCGLTQS
jgi:hypothetical protein